MPQCLGPLGDVVALMRLTAQHAMATTGNDEDRTTVAFSFDGRYGVYLRCTLVRRIPPLADRSTTASPDLPSDWPSRRRAGPRGRDCARAGDASAGVHRTPNNFSDAVEDTLKPPDFVPRHSMLSGQMDTDGRRLVAQTASLSRGVLLRQPPDYARRRGRLHTMLGFDDTLAQFLREAPEDPDSVCASSRRSDRDSATSP